MKIHWAWLLPVALVAGMTGEMIGRYEEMAKVAQQVSMAGQTLADLARTLENEKYTKGDYPDTISGLNVPTESAEFSGDLLSRTKYYRLGDGYIAFVGARGVTVVQAGTPPRFAR